MTINVHSHLSLTPFFISLLSSTFGITKFFAKGPLPILPPNAPLTGALSVKFLILLLLNTMFVVRVFCLEASFFTDYFSGNPLYQIDPLIPDDYRLIIFLLPGLCSFLMNMVRLFLSTKPQDRKYFWKYPQYLLCPMFSPIMFEGNKDQNGDNNQPVQVWKLGSVFNCFFIGCLPQILLLISNHYRKISLWYEKDFHHPSENISYLSFPRDNNIIMIITLTVYPCLVIIFFLWDEIFDKSGCLCKLWKIVCCTSSKPFLTTKAEPPISSSPDQNERPTQDYEPPNEINASVEIIRDTEEELSNEVEIKTIPNIVRLIAYHVQGIIMCICNKLAKVMQDNDS